MALLELESGITKSLELPTDRQVCDVLLSRLLLLQLLGELDQERDLKWKSL